jgi:hypothetical protein
MHAIAVLLAFLGVASAVTIPAATVSAVALPETSKAAAVPVGGSNPNVSAIVAPSAGKNRTDGADDVRVQDDYCGSYRAIPKGHAITLRNNLQANPNAYVYIPVWEFNEVAYGGAKLCFYNPSSSQTWVSYWDAGWTIDYLTNLCCIPWGDYWYVDALDD